MTKDLNDRLDDIFGAPTERVLTDRPAAVEYRAKVAEQANYFQRCGRCNGTGQTRWGTCFKCRGAKGQTFKTSPEQREANRTRATLRRQTRHEEQAFAAEQAFDAWRVANPAAWSTLDRASQRGYQFATEMLEAVRKFGGLTERQSEAVARMVAKDAAWAAERAARTQQAPQVDTAGVDRLKAAFDAAKAYQAEKGLTLRTPKITIGGTTISPAPAAGKNPGALYVKAGQTYLGKVQDGQFFASRECSEETKAQVLKFVADPADAAKVYGQTTGTCCICNATLRSEWKHRGIGPICAAKFGW